jgi:hypothetical protein
LAGKARKPENNTHQVLNTIGKDSALRIRPELFDAGERECFFSIFINFLLAWHAVPLQTIEISVQTQNNEKENPALPSAHSPPSVQLYNQSTITVSLISKYRSQSWNVQY